MAHTKCFFVYFTIKCLLFCSIQFSYGFPQFDTLTYGDAPAIDFARIRQLCLGLSVNELHTHRYHQGSRKCYSVGEQGPCSRNMNFFAEEDNNVFGQCDCDYLNPQGRILVYYELTQQCYFVMTQGYCKSGMYLTLTDDFQPTCVRNECQYFQHHWNTHSNKLAEIVPFQNSCVHLDKPSQLCRDNEVVTFVPTSPFPQCAERRRQSPVGQGIGNSPPTLKCAAGTKHSLDSECRGRVKFGG